MADLKKGDRVTVVILFDQRSETYNGVITGEARDGHAWQIIKDGTKWPRGIHKSFCRPEEHGDDAAVKQIANMT